VFTLFVNGLLFGIWLLGALTPTLLVLSVAGVTLYRLLREEHIDAITFMEDFPPEIPTAEPDPKPEPERHRFIASTIVRPPEISERKEEDDDDTEKGS
jgi:hypothetical protein